MPYARLADAPTRIELDGFFATVSLVDDNPYQSAWYAMGSPPVTSGDRLLTRIEVRAWPARGSASVPWEALCELGVGASGTVAAAGVLVVGTAFNLPVLASADLMVPILIPAGSTLVTRMRLRALGSGTSNTSAGWTLGVTLADPLKLV
jgi:hypothetical protein